MRPLFGLFWLVSFASSVMQIGFLYNEEALQFKPERLNPIEGFQRIFSMKSVMEGVKALLKLAFVFAIVLVILKNEIFKLPLLVNYSVEQIFTYLGDITIRLFAGIGSLMIVITAIDFFFQKWDLEKKMRMTKQEVKEEHKSREGDPMIKARIRKIQREMSQKRMMEDVPKADVIITNPTHIAVALRYDETMIAPKIIAKGGDLIAEKIKKIAREHNIPVVENKPLARAIFKTLEIGQSIPRELYTAVAEVLTYVFKLRRRGR